jgi:hypothetical protein
MSADPFSLSRRKLLVGGGGAGGELLAGPLPVFDCHRTGTTATTSAAG